MADKAAYPAYTVRLLPPDQWAANASFFPFDVTALNPDFTLIVVVEADGQIVADWIAMNTTHLEGLYVHPDHRHSFIVASKLLTGMIEVLRDQKIPAALTIARDPEIARLAENAGFVHVPGELYQLTLPVEG